MALAAIWSNSQDPTARLLQDAIETAGHEAVVLSTGPTTSEGVEVAVGLTGELAVSVADRDLRGLATVFYRKPIAPNFQVAPDQARFLARETMQGIESALSALSPQWVNHPAANRAAADKLGNLVRAQRLGLRVPRTWFGTKPAAVTAQRNSPKLVGKPVTHGLMERSDGASMMFATRLPKNFNPETDMEPGVSMMFQEEIRADFDVRATVIDKAVLAAEWPRDTDELDWRKSEKSGGWKSAALPKPVAAALTRLVAERGLIYGACDLLRTGNEFTFLELNPNGQWGWLEVEAGIPISRTLAAVVGDKA